MKKSQVFTPINIVDEMLNIIDYKQNLYGKKVLEDSFGSGNLLIRIVERYIYDCVEKKYNLDEIKEGLERDVYGVEINSELYNECLSKLNDLLLKHKIKDVKWNLYNENIFMIKWEFKFDYIVSNPPYIKYHELSTLERDFLKQNFKSCLMGNFDYYYAFIENALTHLSKTGRMVHIIPNSIFKNVYANKLRDLLKQNIAFIRSYKNEEIFKGVLVSPVIIMLDKSKESSVVKYKNGVNAQIIEVDKRYLNDKWIFEENIEVHGATEKFGDYFSVSMTVATLFNKAYILDNVEDVGTFYKYGNNILEKEIIKKAASPKGMRKGKEEYIIYPYFYEDNVLRRYDEKFFESRFPNVVNYLKIYNEKLESRKKNSNAKWFEYGRSQALSSLNQPKLLMSTVITKEIIVYELDKETIPYSGLFIVPKKDRSLKEAKEILLSKKFIKYVHLIGSYTGKSSIRITGKDVENFHL